MDYRLIFFLVLAIISGGCSSSQKDDNIFRIVTTTGMIEDAVIHIAGDSAQVVSLMGPGIDPHLYKTTHGDLERLREADLVFYNGLQLEGKMAEVLEKLGRLKPVVAVAENLPENKLLTIPEYNNTYDPHIWFDVNLWKNAVQKVGETLIEIDSANSSYYRTNMQAYLSTLDSLHEAVKNEISTIPAKQRVLITAHDAFGYFGKAYNIEVRGLQGISTLSEPGVRDIKELVDFIIENNIKAVFVETSVSEKAINAVVEGARQRGFDLKIGGSLFSDAMGAKGTPEGTYTGMVNTNVKTMVEALK